MITLINMKQLILLFALLGSQLFNAHGQSEIGSPFFSYLQKDALIISESGLVRGNKDVQSFVSKFNQSNGSSLSYQSNYSVQVNALLDYEIGEIEASGQTFSVMFIKRKDDESGPKIEFLVIYKMGDPGGETESIINQRRKEWVELCNAHNAGKLVKELYTKDAYYYNRGRLLQGTDAISKEYSYMNSSGYSLNLTPKHSVFVTDDITYEIGRCSGSYPLPYMLLWKRLEDGTWKVLMDSNY